MVDKISTVCSDFSDIALWNGYNSSRHSINGSGQLVITPPASTTGYYPLKYNRSTPDTFDLTGAAVSIEVPSVLVNGSGPETIFQLENSDASNALALIKSNTQLVFRRRLSNSNDDTGAATYNSTTHRWWRIAELAGSIYWDTSTDGVTWTNRRSMTTPFAITSLVLNINAGVFNTSFPTPGTAVFDNLNMPSPRSFFSFL